MSYFSMRGFGRALIVLFLLCSYGVLDAGRATAASDTAFVAGTVTNGGVAVANAAVTAAGNDVLVRTRTDAAGRFVFSALRLGTYTVVAVAGGLRGEAHVELGAGGATFSLALEPRTIGNVTVVRAPPVRGSGADVSLNATFLQRSPTSDSFPETLIQLPGTARGANGVVHVNGDHGVIDYVVDGVPLPQALNREVGSEIDPSDVSFVDAIEGAYPAQYGLRFGSILNIATRSGTGPSGFDGNVQYGSFGTLDQTLGYHSALAGGGGYDVAIRNEHTDRALDPPDFIASHDSGSDANQFARVTLPAGGGFTDLTLIHSYRTFAIPNDTQFGEPASTDDVETQDDTFVNLQFRRSLHDSGALSFGPAFKISHIRDFGDAANDWAYGEALNLTPPPFGNGGTATDCADALSAGASFGPTTCAYSLTDDKTALDGILQADYVQRFGRHELRAGVTYDATRVDKLYAVSLQPGNFLGSLLTPADPGGPVTVTDDHPNTGNTYQSYVQDAWRPNDRYEADFGLRYDYFNITSSDLRTGFGAFSPRLKLTRFFGSRASVYAYVGRFFEPFSFENVDPHAAQLLNLPLQPTQAQFDLKPERDTQLEFGGHVPLGPGELGFRIWQKNANDLIDDTQVGLTLLHQDINYTLGRLSAETLDYEQPLPRDGRVYLNLNHTISLNEGCETQLLAPCFGSPTIFTPADHEQRWSVTGGLLANDRRGGWVSANFEYGSGLSSAFCLPATDDCKETPHTIVAIDKGVALAPHLALTGRIDNLFNDRYYVTLLNAQGNHVAPPRTFEIGVRFGR